MSATRLLVLGVVRLHGRAHGYLIRNQLVAWGGEDWANLKWGSIYHALRQLAREGLLTATEISKWPGRVDYELTEQGADAFIPMLRDALVRADHRPDTVAAALAFLTALPRADALDLLRQRLGALEAEQAEHERNAAVADRPEHLHEFHAFHAYNAATAAAWTRGLIERLEAGAYVMSGESQVETTPPQTSPNHS